MDDVNKSKMKTIGSAIWIVFGIDDPEAGVWLEFGQGKKRAWVARANLVGDGNAAFETLERQGIAAITSAVKASIRTMAQGFANFTSDRRVAMRPGWHSPFYIMPDGTVVAPAGCKLARPVVTFALNIKCKRSPAGLKRCLRAFGPVVAHQSLVLTAIAYSLSGAMLSVISQSRYSVLNTGLDFVGPPNSGKTQLLAAAGASWGDDSSVTRGYNDRWTATVAAAMSRIRRLRYASTGRCSNFQTSPLT